MKQLLLIDDEDDNYARSLFSGYLQNSGFLVTATNIVQNALAILDSSKIDLVILGFQLRNSDGVDTLRRIRARSTVPLVIVSNQVETERRVQALEAGADDFIVKPYDPTEITSRIRAVIRRSSSSSIKPGESDVFEYRFDGWRLRHLSRDLLSPDGSAVPLTPAEFNLLAALVKAPMRVLSRDQLLDSITRRDEAPIDRSVDVLVSRIRKKMAAATPGCRFIQTVQGFGYRFAAQVTGVSPRI